MTFICSLTLQYQPIDTNNKIIINPTLFIAGPAITNYQEMVHYLMCLHSWCVIEQIVINLVNKYFFFVYFTILTYSLNSLKLFCYYTKQNVSLTFFSDDNACKKFSIVQKFILPVVFVFQTRNNGNNTVLVDDIIRLDHCICSYGWR